MKFMSHTPSIEELLNPSKRVECPSEGCGEILYRPAVVKHLKKEHGYDPTNTKLFYLCPVPSCERSENNFNKTMTQPFTTIGSIRQHYKMVHSRDKLAEYTCNKCEKKFKSRYYVSQHKFACGEAYICSCNEVFTCMKGLRKHALENKHQIPLSSKLKNVPPNVLPARLIKVKLKKNKSSKYKYILPKYINKRINSGLVLPSELQVQKLVLQNPATDQPGVGNINAANQLRPRPSSTSQIQNCFGSNKKQILSFNGQTYLNVKDWVASNEKKCENNATQTLFLDDNVTDECCVEKDNFLNVNFNSTKDFAIQTNLAMDKWEENSTQTDIGLVEDMSHSQQWYKNKLVFQADPFNAQYSAAACSKDFAGQTNCDFEKWLFGADKADISDNTTQTVTSLDEFMYKDLNTNSFATEEIPHQHSEKPHQIDLKDFASQTANGEDVWLEIPETYLVNHGTQTLIPNSGQVEPVYNYTSVDMNETPMLMDQNEPDLQRFFNKPLPKCSKLPSLSDGNASEIDSDVSLATKLNHFVLPHLKTPIDPSMFLCTGSQTEENFYNGLHASKTAAAPSNFDELLCHIETQTDCNLSWQDNLTNSCTQTMMTDAKSMFNEMLDIQTQTDCNLWSFD